jgi:hypothetical protein
VQLTGETEFDGSEPDGESADRRAVPPFDPIAGMRAMADIQADGLRAASELLERMLGGDRGAPLGRHDPAPQSNYGALLDAWAQVLQRITAGLAEPVGRDGVTVSLDSGRVGPPVRLELTGSGSDGDEASAELWLHNGTPSAFGPLALRCGPLTGTDGAALDGAEVRFEPGELEPLPPRSARAVRVSLAASGSPDPGLYRGTIQADGAPKLWLPLEVAIGEC